MMQRMVLFTVVALAAAVGCGRPEIEDSQRKWLDEQHRLDKRLLEVRGDHNELRRTIGAHRAEEIADDASLERYNRADAILREHEAKLNAIDTMIDRHSLARDVAIRADDAAAVGTGWAAASVDYTAAMGALDAIDAQIDEMDDVVEQIRFRTAPDTIGSNAGVSESRDGRRSTPSSRSPSTSRDDAKTLDNKLGRDEPLEPE